MMGSLLLLQSALGVTGVEGAFRLGAEAALAALRASEAPLSTVLLSTLNAPSVELSSGHHMSAMHKVNPKPNATHSLLLTANNTHKKFESRGYACMTRFKKESLAVITWVSMKDRPEVQTCDLQCRRLM